MLQLNKIARGLSSPAILIAAVWCAMLIGVAIGPIDYPLQPSLPVLVLVATGLLLFLLGYRGGVWCFKASLRHRPAPSAPPIPMLNICVVAASLAGLAGIALLAFDRVVLSGVSNSQYAELLRCAPALVEFIEINRTPWLYVGYLIFSFGFASLVLFFLEGEKIRGWAAIVAQLSILCPVGYALLYAGRMPILFVIVLISAAALVRIGQGRQPLPHGHHLLIKIALVVLFFGIYSNAMWSSRQEFCNQISGLMLELQEKKQERESERTRLLQSQETELKQRLAENIQQNPGKDLASDLGQKKKVREIQQQLTEVQQKLERIREPQSDDAISATNLSKMIDGTKALPGPVGSADVGALLAKMRDSWQVTPREYVLSALESGWLSPNVAKGLLNNYFYLTHGIRIIDATWHARAQFSPLWGVYEISILSPILRVFFPDSQVLASMNMQLRSAEIYGFFPTVWAAAYIDFGAAGSIIYILIWGFSAGWSGFGSRHCALVTPPMLQAFILASILLSPVQGPLGIANSVLVLVSMLFVGLVIDLPALTKPRSTPRDALPETA